ncbi:phage head morphogenesis protein [Pararhodobacter zhoushanensis]|uniref:Phage head morphogenesis protein n=1 Tax=Pararhodobacter zhoushanensis TaxID=2479545 RepID=A0ABT3H2W7_9RHOB|nr:phage head morphogenesis protein [Pararhodobacter zhoushanensis]MCW1934112.1 phage head morphogenesis protein [Pararhodobacter zhoushanensis]
MAPPDAPLRTLLRRPYPEQIAAFRLRLGTLLPTQDWEDLQGAAHDRAFTVAGAMKADLLADLALAMDKAIAQGTGLEAFRRDFRALVVRHGWHGWTGEGTRGGEAWRTRVIYQTNMRTSYAAARMAQLREAGFRYWIYRHGGSMEPRQQHLAIDGLILPSDHPFWDIWAPPNGWGCSCWITGAHTMNAAQRRGGKPDVTLPDSWDQINPKTGAPEGVDRGWGYAPGASATDTIITAAQKAAGLPEPIAADFARSLDRVVDRAWPVWLADARAGRTNQPALLGVVPDTSPHAAAILAPPAAVRVDIPAITDLPDRMRRPMAVLVDQESGDLIYVLTDSDGLPVLEARVRSGDRASALHSLRPFDLGALIAQLASGALGLILGTLT